MKTDLTCNICDRGLSLKTNYMNQAKIHAGYQNNANLVPALSVHINSFFKSVLLLFSISKLIKNKQIRQKYSHTDTQTHAYIHTHTHIYIYIYTYTHTHIHIYIYIYVCVCVCVCVVFYIYKLRVLNRGDRVWTA